MKLVLHTLKVWLPLAAAITALCAIVYGAVQQNYRMNADDPQIQMAEDGARRLAAGEPAQALVPSSSVEMSASLAPFVIVFGPDESIQAGNASLHGQTPSLPNGVLAYTARNGQDRISWQPEPGVRAAAVIAAVEGGKGGYVLAARSLREVEKRVDNLTMMVGVGWLATIGVTLFLAFVLEILIRPG
jgi:hypothetical protein